MFLLPKGNPLAENVPIAKLQLPEALDKLKNARLTGCATFDFPSANCVLIYEDGKLISALLRRDNNEQKNTDALRTLVDLMVLADSGSFNVYGFSKGVSQAVLAQMRGDKVINRQEMRQIDFKALLERIKTERMTATLKIYTDQRVGMILYRDGETLGFCHDTAQTIETTDVEVRQIAALPGVYVDLIVLNGADELALDLAGVVNIRSLWESGKGDVFASHAPAGNPHSLVFTATQVPPLAVSSADIETAIIAIANSIVGKLGKMIAEKELMNVGGIKELKDETRLYEFFSAVEKSSKLLASAYKIKEMRDAISLEVAKL